jgi:hypothetical protein
MNIASSLSAVALALVVAGCASNDTSRVTDAVTSPLHDLNLVQAEIPPKLQEVEKAPYAVPADRSCALLSQEIRELDAVLGTDLDAPPTDSNPGLIERGSTEGKSAAFGALRSTAEGVVPYRTWVRKLTGAERYSKKVAAAIAAGTVRRAFLKGLRVSQACA